MEDAATVNPSAIKKRISGSLKPEKIKEQLIALGHDEASIEIHLIAFNKKKRLIYQGYGFILIACGALIGLMGCVLAMVNPIPQYYHWFLYGFASLAVLVAFIGLVMVFE